MSSKTAEAPFLFTGCWELKEMLGRTARDERQLLETIEEIPLDSLYYHTHSFFLRHQYIAGPYLNDFATWAATQVQDQVLGEKLGILDPFDHENLESLRAEIVTIIDNHLSRLATIPRAIFGEPFYFMQSRIITVPTGLEARTLTEFREILTTADSSVVYYHTFEAMLRLGRRKGISRSGSKNNWAGPSWPWPFPILISTCPTWIPSVSKSSAFVMPLR